ncbi:uncharacterized protein SCHCODRAFT_02519515 [Schizophyllum commune H4-8]|uniref:Expressed protein n=1 Tax=Schizophyllum commune (strain H4-8 / FGSC 9210) TaxID=578458 RepID=D8QI91_SCHCM|nr:uncharacterized protein SCHCODRAFT_02519515 [Schizophyllum commune H4-8]KAI5885911.1 hypothetical protein SCHCODRAFT_02519515 [Schizophyllum commune H4-8]
MPSSSSPVLWGLLLWTNFTLPLPVTYSSSRRLPSIPLDHFPCCDLYFLSLLRKPRRSALYILYYYLLTCLYFLPNSGSLSRFSALDALHSSSRSSGLLDVFFIPYPYRTSICTVSGSCWTCDVHDPRKATCGSVLLPGLLLSPPFFVSAVRTVPLVLGSLV